MMHTGNHIGLPDLELLRADYQSLSTEHKSRVTEIREHIAVCSECADAAEMHAAMVRLQAQKSKVDVSGCPPPNDWLELAGGVLEGSKASALLAHAATCESCATELKMAQEDLGGTDSDPQLGELNSSGAEWQQKLAQRLRAESVGDYVIEPPQTAKILRFPRQRLWGGTIAATLLVGLAIVGWRVYRGQTEETLLAQAYDRQRRTELRFPGGNPVPLASPTRGAAEMTPPVDLLKLKLRAEEHLEKNPNDAYWQQVLGRVALLEDDGDVARKRLDIASALNGNLPGLKVDLAAAFFELGEAGNDPIQYAHAADLYGQVIDNPSASAERPLAYFNRALCWERQSIYSEALRDYQSALGFETNPAWRRDIQRRVEKIQSLLQKSGATGGRQVDMSPSAFLTAVQRDPKRVSEDYEAYLDEATKRWIVIRTSTPDAEKALEKLAAIGLKHNDAWLSDLLIHPQNDVSRAAAEALAAGLEANARGEADGALGALARSESLYDKAGNSPGSIRARVESIYTLQRMGRSQQCIHVGEPFTQSKQLSQYAWLHGYFLLEMASCQGTSGDVVQFTRGVTLALKLSRQDGLRFQTLRAQGFLVEDYNALGMTSAAWSTATRGLEDCAQTPGARMPTYQFLQSIRSAMQTQDLRWAAASVAYAAADASTRVANIQVQAYAHEVLGRADTAIGHPIQAQEAFAIASKLLSSIPTGSAVSLYHADWEADRSDLLAHEGRLGDALLRMRQAESAIGSTDNYDVRRQHYTQFAELFLAANKAPEALDKVLFAIEDAEQSLAETVTEADKLSWERRNGRSYRLLVQCLAEMGRPQEALDAWEWYRTAAYRTPIARNEFHHDPLALPSFPSVPSNRRRDLIVVIAKLESFYVAWSVSGSPSGAVRMAKLSGSPASIDAIVHTFAELCSDRDSSQENIHSIGGNLYHELLSPFEDQIRQTSLLLLDVDSSLQTVPFAAVSRRDNQYLNDTHALVFLPPWWTLTAAPPDTVSSTAKALLVEGAPTVPGSRGDQAVSIPTDYLESDQVARHFPGALLIRNQQNSIALLQKLMPDTEVFHFSGHTVTVANQTGLLLKYPDTLFIASSLSGVSLRRCRLAVLATCSSAGGSQYGIEDTSNLVHALLTAGASNVVATLWDVDSEASRTMMIRFYDLLEEPTPVAEAICGAQRSMRSESITDHPFYWASTQVFSR